MAILTELLELAGAVETNGLLIATFVLYAFYLLILGFRRIFCSPAADIPGPFLAKLTFWHAQSPMTRLYEFYYDVWHTGQYIWKIKELHQRYGPVVRINPYEVHVLDGSFYDEVYTGASRRRDKWPWFAKQSGWPESGFATESHDLHRLRRGALNPFFSKAKVRSLQPSIEAVCSRLVDRFDDFKESGEPLNVTSAFAALSNDIVMKYAFGWDMGRVDAPDFDPSFQHAGESGAQLGHLVKQLPWTLTIMRLLPDNIQHRIFPRMAGFIKLNRDIITHVYEICGNRESYVEKSRSTGNTTIFHSILNSSLPPQEQSPDRLWQDAVAVVVAGTLTTSTVMSTIAFYLLSQPDTLRRLKEELFSAIPDANNMPSATLLENLPYLSGVIKEGLRHGNGVSTRLQRIPVDETLIYTNPSNPAQTYELRPGVPVSLTCTLIHFNPDYFEDPHAFRPERWLDDPEHPTTASNPKLDKYLVPFSRGTRQCVGINLAYTEIYLSLARIFRNFGSKEVVMEGDRGRLCLYETSYERDIRIVGDCTTPVYGKGSQGVRIKVLPVHDA